MIYKSTEKEREQAKNWYHRNIKRAKLSHKKYYQNNKHERIQKAKEYYKNNQEKQKEYRKNYRKLNHKKLKEYAQTNKDYFVKYYNTHPEIWLKSNIQQLVRGAIPFKLPHEKYNLALMAWSKTIKKLYGNQCIICGSKEKLNAHHILHKAKYPKLSLNINNGIPLCKIHHDEVHGKNLILTVKSF